jgi:hypothetical protein
MPPRIDWHEVGASLDQRGYATIPGLIDPAACRDLVALYDDEARFRSRVVMQRHRFGQGEYKYLRYPLPEPVAGLREALYPGLAGIANRWGGDFPATHDAYLAQCHQAGQTRPTPLILKYGPGDYNCLHQDLYGDLVFPLQLTVLLIDGFSGGEFLLVEQRPRSQSMGQVVPLAQGEAVIFPVHHRPVAGTRGTYRVTMRHGVSRIHAGQRFTLGIIFHDAA